ncbi:MAG: SDR family oxidoreductase [Bacteroidetes bacterium]|nr:MAG: SDR family oxidoreductase [Bacteroidota bacterium]
MDTNKVILITGASSGIGKATALFLHEKGYKVYGTSRQPQKYAFPFPMVYMDLEEHTSIEKCVQEILSKEGRIDVLINNAGIAIIGPVEDTTEEEVFKTFNTNVFGVHSVIKNVLPIMRKQRSGYIINISSIGGQIGLPYRAIYSATKFAVEGLSEALRLEVEPFDIKTVIVQPGDMKTEINNHRLIAKHALNGSVYKKGFEKYQERVNKEVENGCPPQEVAKTIYQIINTPKPKLRYRVGFFSQKISIPVKNILPSGLFEKILKIHYDL